MKETENRAEILLKASLEGDAETFAACYAREVAEYGSPVARALRIYVERKAGIILQEQGLI